MKRFTNKVIFVGILILVFVGNLFATNIQTFDTTSETCHLEKLHTKPCAVVSVGDSSVELEQDLEVSKLVVGVAEAYFAFESLVEKNITDSIRNHSNYHPRDLDPPNHNQLARVHI